MPNKLFNQQNQFENAFAKWMSTPYDDWKFRLKNPIHGTFVNGEYNSPPGMDIITQYNLNKNPRWPEASYNDLLNLDKTSTFLNLHSQGNSLATNILSERLQNSKESEFIKDTPNRIKELQRKYLESDLTWSDADTARDWYAIGATPEELAKWDEDSKKVVKGGLLALGTLYGGSAINKGLKLLNGKTGALLRMSGKPKLGRFVKNYGLGSLALDAGFTGSLINDVVNNNATTKDLALDLGLTAGFMFGKPIMRGLRWLGSKAKPLTPIMLSSAFISGTEPINNKE